MLRALLGGSFDPIHRGHVAMADHLLARGLADLVLVVPAWRSPHKDENSAAPDDRLTMCEMAFDDRSRVRVDDREIGRGAVSYTVQTLEELAAEYPDDRLRLVIGADNLPAFPSWRRPGRIQELADIAIFPRDGRVPTPAAIERAGLDARRVVPVTDFGHPVSSTTVRAMLARGVVPDDQLPGPVVDYIKAHRLYQS